MAATPAARARAASARRCSVTNEAAGAPVATPMRSGYVTAALVLSAVLVVVLGIMPGASLDMAIKAASIFGG